jgi:hypothetical protein
MIQTSGISKEMPPERFGSLTTAGSNQQVTAFVAALRYNFHSAAAVINKNSDGGHASSDCTRAIR